jgi:hypothetical protein
MVYKLSHLSTTKDKEQLRLSLCNLVSTVNAFLFIDNPSIPNKFESRDLEAKYAKKPKKTRQPKFTTNGYNTSDRITKIIFNYYKKLYEEKQQPVVEAPKFYPVGSSPSEHEERQKR